MSEGRRKRGKHRGWCSNWRRRTGESRRHNLLRRPGVSVQPSGGTASRCTSAEQLLIAAFRQRGEFLPPVLFGLFPASTYLFSWRHTVIITPGASIKQLDIWTQKENHSDAWLLIEPPRLCERMWTLHVQACTPLCVIKWLRAYRGPRERGAAWAELARLAALVLCLVFFAVGGVVLPHRWEKSWCNSSSVWFIWKSACCNPLRGLKDQIIWVCQNPGWSTQVEVKRSQIHNVGWNYLKVLTATVEEVSFV